MGSIEVIVDPLDISASRGLQLRDAGPDELDQVAGLLGEVSGAFREWNRPHHAAAHPDAQAYILDLTEG